jgi:hypothetical protein
MLILHSVFMPEQIREQQKTRLICSDGFMIFSFHHTPFSSRLRASMMMMVMYPVSVHCQLSGANINNHTLMHNSS